MFDISCRNFLMESSIFFEFYPWIFFHKRSFLNTMFTIEIKIHIYFCYRLSDFISEIVIQSCSSCRPISSFYTSASFVLKQVSTIPLFWVSKYLICWFINGDHSQKLRKSKHFAECLIYSRVLILTEHKDTEKSFCESN